MVALETAVLTHGLPRTPRATPASLAAILPNHRWDERGPANRELSLALEAAVATFGAVPATIGVLEGVPTIGIGTEGIRALGAAADAVKCSERDLAGAMVARRCGGTTVAGTLAILGIAMRAGDRVPVFATGGIGGVHRGWQRRWDVSADLLALSRTPVCVVSAGAKSILDLDATVEMLDTLGVPVLGLGTRWFPRFLTAGAPPLAVQRSVACLAEAAAICTAHWGDLGASSGVLIANPPPPAFALPLEEVEQAIVAAVDDAERSGHLGADLTPYLLGRLAERTGGRSVEANIAALLANATRAAELAVALA